MSAPQAGSACELTHRQNRIGTRPNRIGTRPRRIGTRPPVELAHGRPISPKNASTPCRVSTGQLAAIRRDYVAPRSRGLPSPSQCPPQACELTHGRRRCRSHWHTVASALAKRAQTSCRVPRALLTGRRRVVTGPALVARVGDWRARLLHKSCRATAPPLGIQQTDGSELALAVEEHTVERPTQQILFAMHALSFQGHAQMHKSCQAGWQTRRTPAGPGRRRLQRRRREPERAGGTEASQSHVR